MDILRACAAVLLLCVCAARAPGAFTRVVVFGDSLSDTGNVLSTTSGLPFIDPRPVAPWYDTGRWTNGSATNGQALLDLADSAYSGVWHERLAARLGIPAAQSSLQVAGGTNYAYGSATTTATNTTFVSNIGYQVSNRYLMSGMPVESTTLHCLWGGANDIRNAAGAGNWTQQSVRFAAVSAVGRLEDYIEAVVNAAPAGTEVSFVWPNAPPLHLVPDFAGETQAKRDAVALASLDFRAEQLAAADRLRSAFANLRLFTVDIHGLFEAAVMGTVPELAGVNVATPVLDFGDFSALAFNPPRNPLVPSGASPDQYMFWDRLHPTARMHDVVGGLAFAAIPAPGALLTVGLVPILGSRRPRRDAA